MSRIEDYALLGDLHSAALVGRDGSIDWMCLPRFDSPACFAALLDSPRAGRWLLAPAAGGSCTSRRYDGETLVLATDWTVEGVFPDLITAQTVVNGRSRARWWNGSPGYRPGCCYSFVFAPPRHGCHPTTRSFSAVV